MTDAVANCVADSFAFDTGSFVEISAVTTQPSGFVRLDAYVRPDRDALVAAGPSDGHLIIGEDGRLDRRAAGRNALVGAVGARYQYEMAKIPAGVRSVQVDLPEEVFHHHPWEPAEIAEEMRVLWLLEQVRQRRLGYGKASELAEMPLARFVRLMGKYAITPFDYDPGELREELDQIV